MFKWDTIIRISWYLYWSKRFVNDRIFILFGLGCLPSLYHLLKRNLDLIVQLLEAFKGHGNYLEQHSKGLIMHEAAYVKIRRLHVKHFYSILQILIFHLFLLASNLYHTQLLVIIAQVFPILDLDLKYPKILLSLLKMLSLGCFY